MRFNVALVAAVAAANLLAAWVNFKAGSPEIGITCIGVALLTVWLQIKYWHPANRALDELKKQFDIQKIEENK